MVKFKVEYANQIREKVLIEVGYDDMDFLKFITEIKNQKVFMSNTDVNKCIEVLKQMYKDKSNSDDTGKDVMLERTILELNGHLFKITPITLGEEIDFQVEFRYSIIPKTKNGANVTDDDVVNMLSSFFASNTYVDKTTEQRLAELKKKSIISLIKDRFKKKRYDCEYYKDTIAYGLVKWMEKKIYIDNKHIRFYDLERKYGLNKLEIYKLMCKFMEISNFPQHLPQQ